MFRKIIFALLFFVMIALNEPTQAAPETVVDQACTIENASDAIGIDLTQSSAFQLFTPTKDNIESVQVILATPNSNYAKAKIKLYRMADIIGHPDGTLISEKFVAIQGESYVKVSYDNMGISEGVYAISVEAVHREEKVYWVATTGTCYNGGYSVIGGQIRVDLDFFFMTTASLPISVGIPSSNPPAPVVSQSSNTTNTSNQTASTTTSSANATPTNQETKDVPSGSKKITNLASIENSDTSDKSQMNQESAYQDKLMADKELQQQIVLILREISEEKARDKGGAFGLQGMVGDLLTWPVFYTVSGLLLLMIIVLIVKSIKRKKPEASKTETSNNE